MYGPNHPAHPNGMQLVGPVGSVGAMVRIVSALARVAGPRAKHPNQIVTIIAVLPHPRLELIRTSARWRCTFCTADHLANGSISSSPLQKAPVRQILFRLSAGIIGIG